MASSDSTVCDEPGGPLVGAGREVDDGIIELVTPQSRWLLDVVRRRFQRCSRASDVRRALAFGDWTPMRRVDLDGDVLTVEPVASHPIRVVLERDPA